MSNPPYGGVELPFLKGDLEGFLYEVMRDTIKCKNLPYFCPLIFEFCSPEIDYYIDVNALPWQNGGSPPNQGHKVYHSSE